MSNDDEFDSTPQPDSAGSSSRRTPIAPWRGPDSLGATHRSRRRGRTPRRRRRHGWHTNVSHLWMCVRAVESALAMSVVSEAGVPRPVHMWRLEATRIFHVPRVSSDWR